MKERLEIDEPQSQTMRRLSVKDHVANRTRNKREINRTDEREVVVVASAIGCLLTDYHHHRHSKSVLQSVVVVSKRKRGVVVEIVP